MLNTFEMGWNGIINALKILLAHLWQIYRIFVSSNGMRLKKKKCHLIENYYIMSQD